MSGETVSALASLHAIASEIENLNTGDPEADHGRGDDLLLDALRAAADDETRPAIDRIIAAWNEGAKGWWWA